MGVSPYILLFSKRFGLKIQIYAISLIHNSMSETLIYI